MYSWKEGEGLLPSRSEAKYLRDRVKTLLAQVASEADKMAAAIDAKIVLDTPVRRKQTIENFQKAVASYDKLLIGQPQVEGAGP